MAENTQKGLEFDLMKSIKKGLLDGAKSGGWSLVTWGIKKAVGYQDPQTKANEQILAELKEIQGKLDDIIKMEERLYKSVQSQTGLIVTELKLNNYSSMYKDFRAYVVPVNSSFKLLMQIVENGQAEGHVNFDYVKTNIQKLYGDLEKVQENTAQIADMLGVGPYKHSPNLLESFTDWSIASLETKGSGGIAQLAQGIMDQLMEGVFNLYKGYTVVLNLMLLDDIAKNYFPDYKSPLPKDTTLEEQAVAYVNGLAKDVFTPITECFRSCMLRLILAAYDPEVDAQDPVFIPDQMLQDITTKTDLMAWLIANNDPAQRHPGVALRLLTRYSRVVMKSVALQPQGFESSTGTKRAFPSKYQGDILDYFYKCVDFIGGKGSNDLVPFEHSDIQVQEYVYPWSVDKEKKNAALSIGGSSRTVTPSYFDRHTLQPVKDVSSYAKDENDDYPDLVWFGQLTDAQDILPNFIWSNKNGVWKFDDGDIYETSGDRIDWKGTAKTSADFNSIPHATSFEGSVPAGIHYSNYHDEIYTYRYLRYAPSDLFPDKNSISDHKEKLRFLTDGEYDVYIYKKRDIPDPMQNQPMKVRFYVELSYPEHHYHNDTVTNPKSYELFYHKYDNDSGTVDKKDRSLDFWGSDNKSDNKAVAAQEAVYVHLIPETRVRLQWRIRITEDTNKYSDSNRSSVKVKAKVRIARARVAWSVPKFTKAS